MKTKSLFFTAILAVFTLFASSCDKDEPINSPLPLEFYINFIDNEGNSLLNADNCSLFEENITITYNNSVFYLNKEASMVFRTDIYIPNILIFGAWRSNNFNNTFTINYKNNTSDNITFNFKNYSTENCSGKVYLNGIDTNYNWKTDKSVANITIVKPADFFKKMQNAE